MMPLFIFLLTSIIMFIIGIYGIVSTRNMLRMLLSAEIIFNSALLALLSLSSISISSTVVYTTKTSVGGIIALFAIGLSASEIGVTIAIAILLFQIKRNVDVYELKKFRG